MSSIPLPATATLSRQSVSGLSEVLSSLCIHGVFQLLPHKLAIMQDHAIYFCISLCPREPIVLVVFLCWRPLIELPHSARVARGVPPIRKKPPDAIATHV